MNSSYLKRSSLYFLLAVFLLVGLTAVAVAEPTQQRGERRDSALVQGGQTPAPAGQPAAKEYPKLPEENVSVTNHVITVGGKPLPYTAVAGTLLLKADDGRP
ncbi:MAG: hypothetical protein MUQ25_03675, partial [Candidatus Aminicenantes bacterium]|nr:hypothetical protein [Candidatus Aminicenantes bacterium]